jgi:hypothetical protein
VDSERAKRYRDNVQRALDKEVADFAMEKYSPTASYSRWVDFGHGAQLLTVDYFLNRAPDWYRDSVPGFKDIRKPKKLRRRGSWTAYGQAGKARALWAGRYGRHAQEVADGCRAVASATAANLPWDSKLNSAVAGEPAAPIVASPSVPSCQGDFFPDLGPVGLPENACTGPPVGVERRVCATPTRKSPLASGV